MGVRVPPGAPCDVSGHCERLNPRFAGSAVFSFGLVSVVRVDVVFPEDGAVQSDHDGFGVVDQGDDVGAGVAAADAEVEHFVAVAE